MIKIYYSMIRSNQKTGKKTFCPQSKQSSIQQNNHEETRRAWRREKQNQREKRGKVPRNAEGTRPRDPGGARGGAASLHESRGDYQDPSETTWVSRHQLKERSAEGRRGKKQVGGSRWHLTAVKRVSQYPKGLADVELTT